MWDPPNLIFPTISLLPQSHHSEKHGWNRERLRACGGGLTELKADEVVRGGGDVEQEARPTRLAAAGWTPTINKIRVRVGVGGSPAPEKKVTGLRAMDGAAAADLQRW
jgi:hypothetical protein